MLRGGALLAWLKKAIDQPNISDQMLSNPKIFMKLAEQLPGMENIQYIQGQSSSLEWQNNYVNFKTIYQAIQNYYRNYLNSSFPSGLPSINLVLMSKGQEKQSLIVLLEIIFIACIECPAKEKFIPHIMALQEEQMTELMQLIQQTSLKQQEAHHQEQKQLYNDKQKIDELYFKIQSLYSQNDALRNQLLIQSEEKNKLIAQIQKLEEDKRKLRRELDQKMIYLQQKQQQQLEQQSTNKVLSQSNEEIIEILKKQLLEQENKYFSMVAKYKEQINDLNDQHTNALQKISELESESFATISSKVKHESCVNKNQHQTIVNKLQLKIKDKEKRQIQLQRELIKMKFELEEKQKKVNKGQKQVKTVTQMYEKLKDKGPMVTRKTAKEVQIAVLKGIRDNLKSKFQKDQKQNKV